MWTDMLEIAGAWGMPPWEVEGAPALWIDRFREWTNAKNERNSHDAPGRGQTKQVGNKRVKRLV